MEVKSLYEAHEAELLKDRAEVDVTGLDEEQAKEAVKKAVSYTHLDVYKRQEQILCSDRSWAVRDDGSPYSGRGELRCTCH